MSGEHPLQNESNKDKNCTLQGINNETTIDNKGIHVAKDTESE